MTRIKLWTSVIFIAIYVVLANAGAMLTERIGTAFSGQIFFLFGFSVFMLTYIKKRELMNTVGLAKVGFTEIKRCLFYIPLVLIALANGAFFFDSTNNIQEIVLTVIFMLFVAFLEELLVRGLLFKSIEESQSTKAAVLISGAAFGLGHIINLLNGYTGVQQIIQIVLAFAIGIVLALLFVRTKSIVPGIVFHFVFNIASALSIQVEPLYDYIAVGIILLIALAYMVYLINVKVKKE